MTGVFKAQLIPRYNWEYSFIDFIKASVCAFSDKSHEEVSFRHIFGTKPIYTLSGRTSLYTILKALNLRDGANVGVPLFCCSVVFDAIKEANLTPKFIDIHLDDYNISAEDIEQKRSGLSAVIVPHMFGFPADMDAIQSVCGELPIIEDCAHSLFSKYKGRYTGTLSTASFFSFRSGKYISAGEGSAIFTNDASLRKCIRGIVDGYQEKSRYQEVLHCTSTYIKSTLYNRPWYGMIGYPIGRRLDNKLNLSAKSGFETARIRRSDLSIILKRLVDFQAKIEKQRKNSLYLLEKIKLNNIVMPTEKKECWSNYYQFALRFERTEQRDIMADYLFTCGIDTAKYLDDIVDVARKYHKYDGSCANAELCSKRVLVIPNHYTLSRKDLDFIAVHINRGASLLSKIEFE